MSLNAELAHMTRIQNHPDDCEGCDLCEEVFDEEPAEPVVDGPRRGQCVKYRGVAAYVVRDDGERWMHVRMVGDDTLHKEDRDDYTDLCGEYDYCAECGQIGCVSDGRDRSEVSE